MLEIRTVRAWWLTLCAVAAAGCSAGSPTQVVTGHVTSSDAIAVRAIDGDAVVTAAKVRADRSFTLALPSGSRYRLEVLTAAGVKHVLSAAGALTFEVCQPTQPWDVGTVSGTDDPPVPPTCDPSTDLKCPCDPTTDPTCKPSPPPPPPACDPKIDPTCGCPPDDPKCEICKDPGGADCVPPPPTTCDDVKDPACGDPCAIEPLKCGCPKDAPGCWGPPPASPPCDAAGTCSPKDGWTPEHPPVDFGCGKSA